MYNSIILVWRIQGRKTETGKKAPLPKSANCPSPPLFRQFPLYIVFLWTPLPKNGFFSEPTKFVNKLYLSLNNSDFSLFLCNNFNPPPSPWKRSHLSFPATPSKMWHPVEPHLFENLVEGSIPYQKWLGGCTLWSK